MTACGLFIAPFEYSPKWCTCSAVWLLHGWCHVKLLMSRRKLCVHHSSLHCHFIRSHVCRMHVFGSNLPPVHFYQNDRDLLRATAVTRGCNGYRNKSQYTKLTTKKKILPPLLPGLEPETFRSRFRRSTIELSPLPAYHSADKNSPSLQYRRRKAL